MLGLAAVSGAPISAVGEPVATLPTRDLCDDLVTELTSAAPPGSNDSYARAYFKRTADVDDTAVASSTGTSPGRIVTICPTLPVAYSYEPQTRGKDLYTHHVSVLVEKRLASGTAGDWTRALIDTEVDWVYTNIVLGFDWDFRAGAIPTFNRMLVTVSAEVELFDLEDLLAHTKLFKAQVDLVFQELVDA